MYTAETGNMWTAFEKTDHFIVTTNEFIKKNGALVMGAGIAKQVRDRWPGIDKLIGDRITKLGTEYGIILGKKIGCFQVKYHFKDMADLDLIAMSARKLAVIASAQKNERFDLNFPGIGNGKLAYADVAPLLEVLPPNVHVWTFK